MGSPVETSEKRAYELIYVLQPELDQQGVQSVDEAVQGVIARQDGEVTDTELWGKRTLAYPIEKHVDGIYILHRLSMPGTALTEIERSLRFNEDVLRFLCFRTDE